MGKILSAPLRFARWLKWTFWDTHALHVDDEVHVPKLRLLWHGLLSLLSPTVRGMTPAEVDLQRRLNDSARHMLRLEKDKRDLKDAIEALEGRIKIQARLLETDAWVMQRDRQRIKAEHSAYKAVEQQNTAPSPDNPPII